MISNAKTAENCRQKELYDTDGAVLIRQLLSSGDLQGVLDDLGLRVEMLAAREGLPLPARGTIVSVGWLSESIKLLCQHDEHLQGVLYDAISRAPSLHRLSVHSCVTDLVENLLGPTFEVHPRLILLISMPMATWHLAGWHQDWFYNEGPANSVTLWIPLHDVDPSGGALTVALGEHRSGLFDHREEVDQTTKWMTIDKDRASRFRKTIDISARAGDCLALHSLAPHTANVNRSDQVRMVLNFRYRDLADAEYQQNNWRIGEIKQARAALARSVKPT